MGNRTSASAPLISPAEARAHLLNEEFTRLQNAFGRIKKSQLNYEDFGRYVLGGANVPEDARMALFKFFSCGSDTISFDNLISALVGICRIEGVQANFIEEHREFASWGLRPPLLTIPVNDSYISFYEVMSYVTHLSVREVQELETVFFALSGGGVKLLPTHWKAATSGCFPEAFTKRLFVVFDENNNDEIDFREMVCGVSAMCRGPFPSRLSFLAKLWDEDRDNLLSVAELSTFYEELNVPEASRNVALSGKGGQHAAMVDVAQWAMQNEQFVKPIYAMALEIGHICFGLRPENSKTELCVVGSFEMRLKESTGSGIEDWNIISTVWHRQWQNSLDKASDEPAATYHEPPPPVDNSPLLANNEPIPGSSKLICLTSDICIRRDILRRDWLAIPRCLFKAFVRWHGHVKTTDDIVRKRLQRKSGEWDMELFPLQIILERRKAAANNGAQQASSVYPWAYAQSSRSTMVSYIHSICARELRQSELDVRLWLRTDRAISPTPSLSSPVSGAERVTGTLSSMSMSSGNGSTSGYSSSSSTMSPNGIALLDDPLQRLADLVGGEEEVTQIKLLVELRDRATGVWMEEARLATTGESIAQASARGAAVGLINYGNYCYRNVAVQCLARVAPLRESLLMQEGALNAKIAKKKDKKAVATALQFIKLLKEMRTTAKKNISPVQFNEAIQDTKAFHGNDQHDCEEFVSYLLSQLHYTLKEEDDDEKKKREKEREKREEDLKKLERTGKEEEDLPEEEKAAKAWETFLSSDSSLVTLLFSGQLRSSLICSQCSTASSTFDVFSALPVPIGFEHVELYEITVVRRDASIPLRYGVRLSRDSSIAALRAAVGQAAGLEPQQMQLWRISSQASKRLTEMCDHETIGRPSPAIQLFALESGSSDGGARSFPAVHRRMQHNHEAYLLGAACGCTVSIFAVPIPVKAAAGVESTSLSLYEDVWRQLGRFLCNPTPSFANRALDPCENASAGYPFTLSLVDSSLEWCATCPALRFCRGCPLRPEATEKRLLGMDEETLRKAAIAVDWQPVALYLKYNHSQTLSYANAPQLALLQAQHARPSTLAACLTRFASPEQLEDTILCKKCNEKTPREKVMEIWQLPQFLIIQLKRFEYVREEGRIGKCKRLIDFPLSDFDAASFLRKGVNKQPLMYDCIAIANHYGELQAGHFVAYVRSKGGAWLLLNDCTVREVTEDQVDKAAAYLLFYERRNLSEGEGQHKQNGGIRTSSMEENVSRL